MLKELGPTLIIGSPLCVSMPIEAMRAVDLDAAWSHLQFCMELYTWQLQRCNVFLHEQPCGAQCWNEPCMRKLIEMDVVECRRGDQCPFGPQVRGNDGTRALVLKPTIWVSNCLEILDEVCEKCSNNHRPRREWHKHTSALMGTCSHAERYPVRLVRAILRGLRRALRRGLPGGGHLCEIESGPTLEERGPEEESAILSSEPDPSGSPWAPTAQTEFFDDLTGFALEPPLVRLARIEEMNYLIMDLDVWEIVDRDFALERMNGMKPIPWRLFARWLHWR